ncbi:MAG TPA: hypothetical protein VHC97_14690 [Thermoanaerobaculia bacterium]|jgi:DNA-directed RNA polymerase specialized sigma24 family protein|nr:hypothetical protein [Thermoanaerobaculia bacterium]
MDSFEESGFCPRTRREKAFQSAWEELVERYGALLRGRVRRSLREAGLEPRDELVEERVQEVYYRLLLGGPRRLRLLRRWSDGRVAAYLARAADRVVLDEVRAKRAVKRGGLRLAFAGGLADIAEMAELSHRAVDPRGTPEEAALFAERQRLVLKGFRRVAQAMMDPENRGRCLRVLRLAFLEGWSSHEIVRAEGGRLAASTVDTLVHRARRRLARGGLELPSRRRALVSSSP